MQIFTFFNTFEVPWPISWVLGIWKNGFHGNIFPLELSSVRTEIVAWLLKVKYLPDYCRWQVRRTCRFLCCIMISLSSSSSSLKDRYFYFIILVVTLVRVSLILLFNVLLSSIEIKGQELNWDIVNAFIKDLHLSKSI